VIEGALSIKYKDLTSNRLNDNFFLQCLTKEKCMTTIKIIN